MIDEELVSKGRLKRAFCEYGGRQHRGRLRRKVMMENFKPGEKLQVIVAKQEDK